MDAIINSFFLVFVGEIGDKTQLLTLVLLARFKKPWTIFFGIFVATILNHALAAYVGQKISELIPETILVLILAFIFFAFGLWMLIPDSEGEVKATQKWGLFTTTVVSFFLAEMGDKTQLATIALAAEYSNTFLVTVGSTLGMLASNGLALIFGEKLLKKLPMQWIRRLASFLFVVFAIYILANHFIFKTVLN